MIKSITITEYQWAQIHRQLAKDYPSSYILIREKMKDKLGFVVRRHRSWTPANEFAGPELLENIVLDFYNESKKTFFLVKYGHLLTLDKN